MKIDIKTTIETSKLTSWEVSQLLNLISKAELDGTRTAEHKTESKPEVKPEVDRRFITVTKPIPVPVFEPQRKMQNYNKKQGVRGESSKTKIIMDYILKHLDLTDAEIAKNLNLKDGYVAGYARKKLEIKRPKPAKKVKKTINISDEFRQRQRDRMKYLKNRATELINMYKWSYEKAFRFASEEYKMKYHRPTVSTESIGVVLEYGEPIPSKPELVEKFELPPSKPTWKDIELTTLTKDSQELLHSMLKNIAGIHQGRINRQVVEWYLKRRNGFNWNNPAYEDFFTEVLVKIKKICEYLDIKDKFRFNTETKEIIYNG